MYLTKLRSIILILSAIFIQNICAQQTVPVTGGEATGSGGNSSYSVGQIAFSSYSNSATSINQGIEQPYEIYEITNIKNISNIELSLFPNPTNGYITLKIPEINFSGYNYKLYNVYGQLIETINIESPDTRINLGKQASATYLLKVLQDQKEIKLYKIIKY